MSCSRCSPLSKLGALVLVLGICGGAVALRAAEIVAKVVDQKGAPVADAIVLATPSEPFTQPAPAEAEIVQRKRAFEPELTVVPVGSRIRFPNRDTVQHHVYSFSPAKKFDIPLYIGDSPETITVDKPGIIALGCNIHDWMVAYILVVETPFHARTDAEGVARVRIPGSGGASVEVWHPRSKDARKTIEWQPTDSVLDLRIALKPDIRRRAPSEGGQGYR